jgi:hypothetical protein
MVDHLVPLIGWATPAVRLLAAADQKAEPLLMRLDPVSRAKVLMSLLALVLMGIALVAMVWLGARHLRRIARKPVRPTVEHEDDWYRKPLIPHEPRSPGAHEGP